MKFGIGQPVRRVEDARFLTGTGSFMDDLNLPGQAHAWMVRSPHAHADIVSLDVEAASAAPGVIAVLTGADAVADGLGNMPDAVPVQNRDGTDMVQVPRPLLVADRVRHVGDTVAMVVAETRELARDAAELVAVGYKALPAVTDARAALAPGAPQIWDHAPGNLCLDWEIGLRQETEAAFEGAAHVTRIEVVNNRLVSNAMETRGALGEYDAGAELYRLQVCSQGVFSLRDAFAGVLQVPPERLHVITPDVGGGFGTKAFPYPEYGLALWAAKRLGRPVKWISSRDEAFLTDAQGRDHVTVAEVAMDDEGLFLGIRVNTVANLGAYLQVYSAFVATFAGGRMHAGAYAVPAVYVNVRGAFTNTVPVDAYRGAGRPEAAYVIERLVDAAARDLGLAPDELRRRNFIAPGAMPHTTPTGVTYDSGEFARNQDDAMKLAGWDGFGARRAEAGARGKLRGIGLSYYVEITDGATQEASRIDVDPGGQVIVHVGTQQTGQGHTTSFAQIIAERLGVPFDRITIKEGDSNELPMGGGTGGSRSVVMGGGAINMAALDVIEKGRAVAAEDMEVAPADVEFADGRFTVSGTDRSLGLFEVAQGVTDGGGVLSGSGDFQGEAPNFPNGAHICEVEIDPDTGHITIERYTVVDDFGVVLNPLLLAGQVHGGISQGIGQALLEHCLYDQDSGQLVTGSFMDYAMPRADDMPSFACRTNEVRCRTNWLGAKGAGEAGTVGAAPALVNAVVDALEGCGVGHVDMPLWPENIWRAIRAARP